MHWLKFIALLLVGGYLAACGALYLLQDRLIFHPRALAPEYVYDWGEEVAVPVGEGEIELSTVWVRKPEARGVVIYFHGNVGDNNRGRYQARRVLEQPYDVVLVDYRGFGKSGGSVSDDAQLLADVQAVYDTVAAAYPEERIHLLGYSLGSGMAAYLAAANDPAHLTLVAPYTSLVDMKNLWFWWAPDFLLKYRLDTESLLGEVDCPVDIYHGTADRLIPFDMAERLADVAWQRARLHPLRGVSHRGAILQVGAEWLR